MSQKIGSDTIVKIGSQKGFENVGENWVLYDTCLCGAHTDNMDFHEGWFTGFAFLGAATSIPFFNVRNRNVGLAYNNQDKRDQLAFAFRIFTIGVTFFSPGSAMYRDTAGVPTGPETTCLHFWETELPKHASIELQVKQDERLKLGCLMAPPGYGAVGGGVAQGDPENVAEWATPNVSLWNFNQGIPELTNKWAFRNPLEVPRTANLSVIVRFSEYGRQMLQTMPGPHQYPFQHPTSGYAFKSGMCGIQVVLGGQRLVQQRGQAHA